MRRWTWLVPIAVGALLAVVFVSDLRSQTGMFPNPDRLQVGAPHLAPTPLALIKSLSASVSGTSIPANTCTVFNNAFTGLAPGDIIAAANPQPTGVTAGIVSYRVNTTDSIAITVCNPGGGAVTPATGTWTLLVVRPVP